MAVDQPGQEGLISKINHPTLEIAPEVAAFAYRKDAIPFNADGRILDQRIAGAVDQPLRAKKNPGHECSLLVWPRSARSEWSKVLRG